MWETIISYITVDEKTGNDKYAKARFIVDNKEFFAEVEDRLTKEWAHLLAGFEVTAIKRSKIKEVTNTRTSDDEKLWLAEFEDIFTTDEGEEKSTRYKVLLFSKTFDTAMAFATQYLKQGYDMTLVSLKRTQFEDVLL